MRQARVVIEQRDDLGGVVDFFVGAAGGAEGPDVRFCCAFRMAGQLHGVITERPFLGVQFCAAIILLDLRGESGIVRGGTEILPVGFQSIEAVVGPGRNGGERLALCA